MWAGEWVRELREISKYLSIQQKLCVEVASVD